MKRSALISVRMPEELMTRLDDLAKSLDRSRSYMATLAIEEYVSIQEWQVKAIQEGIEDARAGRIVPHEVVVKELKRQKNWNGSNSFTKSAYLFDPFSGPTANETPSF